MDQYNMKYLWRKMCHTSRRKHLRYHGPYHLRIAKKTTVKVDTEEFQHQLLLCVETQDGHYRGWLEVGPRQYGNYKVGEHFCYGGVIQYTKKDNCYYMSKHADARIAIRKAVNSSRIRFAFLVVVMLLVILI